MAGSFELFEHTADIGVRARAGSLAELVGPCVEGLYAVIGKLRTTGDGAARMMTFEGEDAAMLLRDYLAELLRLFETDHVRAVDVMVEGFTEQQLTVRTHLSRVDMVESEFEREVKAVTYHELAVCAAERGYEATYIVDI